MAGTIEYRLARAVSQLSVSMESGLDGRNNYPSNSAHRYFSRVSMESGLDGRNNSTCHQTHKPTNQRLNGVRPRWPEQLLHQSRYLDLQQ